MENKKNNSSNIRKVLFGIVVSLSFVFGYSFYVHDTTPTMADGVQEKANRQESETYSTVSFSSSPTVEATVSAYHEMMKHALNQSLEVRKMQQDIIKKDILEMRPDINPNELWTISRAIVDDADIHGLDYKLLASIIAMDNGYKMTDQEIFMLAGDLEHYGPRLGTDDHVIAGYYVGIRSVINANYNVENLDTDTRVFVESVLFHMNSLREKEPKAK